MGAEEISHLERKLAQLEAHVTEQDAEIYRLSKQVEAVARRLERLEGTVGGDEEMKGLEMHPAAEERPPHY